MILDALEKEITKEKFEIKHSQSKFAKQNFGNVSKQVVSQLKLYLPLDMLPSQ